MDYVERPDAKDLVRVAVTVESDSQKGIMIGKGGAALKQLSTAAREGIEDFVGRHPLLTCILISSQMHHYNCRLMGGSGAGRPVFLDISIKVKKGWRADEDSVAKFGY